MWRFAVLVAGALAMGGGGEGDKTGPSRGGMRAPTAQLCNTMLESASASPLFGAIDITRRVPVTLGFVDQSDLPNPKPSALARRRTRVRPRPQGCISPAPFGGVAAHDGWLPASNFEVRGSTVARGSGGKEPHWEVPTCDPL